MSKKEKDLITRAKQFDKTAPAEIYDEYSPGLYRYSYRQLGDQDTAEECVAETFSRFLHVLKKGKGPRDHLKSYLYRIAHNWITDQYRRKKFDTVLLEEELNLSGPEQTEQAVEEKIENTFVRSQLAMLTPEQRQVIMLKFVEEWSNQEIAAAMNKTIGAVKALQSRGLDALRRLLDKEDEVKP